MSVKKQAWKVISWTTTNQDKAAGVLIAIRESLLKSDANIAQRLDIQRGRIGAIKISIKQSNKVKPKSVFYITSYAPVENASNQQREAFWERMRKLHKAIPLRTTIIGGGDMNARVGYDKYMEYDKTTKANIGRYGAEKENRNGAAAHKIMEVDDLRTAEPFHAYAVTRMLVAHVILNI